MTLTKKMVDSFNKSQDKYWVQLHQYTVLDHILLDIMRKQGPDIFFMMHMDYNSLAESGMFEELTPYFESSEVVKKEDIVESIWRAGSVGEGYYYVIPRFVPSICLVEKGYTDGGEWTIEEYLKLAEKYPEGMLDRNIATPEKVLSRNLVLAIDEYIDWEKRTCSFDSKEFIALLENLKSLSTKKYDTLLDKNTAEQLYQKSLLVYSCNLTWHQDMNDYKDLRDTLLQFCEIAGVPNEEGKVKYRMSYDAMYGINAESENKEGAWAYLEYLLSEEYQTAAQGGTNLMKDGKYSPRLDVLEASLDAEITAGQEDRAYHMNSYTKETVKGIAPFTEEDKQVILDIVKNCYCDGAMSSAKINIIINEELAYFFEGTKSAQEVAKIIQSRISLYLME